MAAARGRGDPSLTSPRPPTRNNEADPTSSELGVPVKARPSTGAVWLTAGIGWPGANVLGVPGMVVLVVLVLDVLVEVDVLVLVVDVEELVELVLEEVELLELVVLEVDVDEVKTEAWSDAWAGIPKADASALTTFTLVAPSGGA